ncbi:MAG: hypothetical protein WB689_00795 [Xanthobacteraceae bacterium]
MTGSLKKMLEANIEDRATRDRTPGPSPIPKPDNWVSARGKGGWGLFHRDPKRIVGVLRVTLLNRLNNSREWAELPLGRQTLHHDWLSDYRGLQTPLFILSLGIELAHSFNLNVSG